MGPGLALFLVSVFALVVYLLISAIRGSRSPLFLIVAAAVAGLMSLLAWYAFAESNSAAWTAGYLMAGASSVCFAVTAWVRGGKPGPTA